MKRRCFHESLSLDQEMRMSEVLTMISPENKEEKSSLIHSGATAIFALEEGQEGVGLSSSSLILCIV